MPALLALARGRRDWSETLRDGSVTAAGDPDLVSQVGEWFQSAAVPQTHPQAAHVDPGPESAASGAATGPATRSFSL